MPAPLAPAKGVGRDRLGMHQE